MNEHDLGELRRLRAGGVSQRDLAEQFGLSQSGVSRLTTGQRRAALPVNGSAGAPKEGENGFPLPPPRGRRAQTVAGALEVFLRARELDEGGEVRAATARSLALQLDATTGAGTAAAAGVAPRLAAQLLDVLREVEGTRPPAAELDVRALLAEVLR